MSIWWIVAGRQISEFVDRLKTSEISLNAIHRITYEGRGDGGTLAIDSQPFGLAPLNPHVGTNKENELALAKAGKVFAFGAMRSTENYTLAAEPQGGDRASLSARDSFLPWLNLKFVTNHLPVLQRHRYSQLIWRKPNGAKLEMLWRSEPRFDPDAAPSNYEVDALIRIDISNGPR